MNRITNIRNVQRVVWSALVTCHAVRKKKREIVIRLATLVLDFHNISTASMMPTTAYHRRYMASAAAFYVAE